MTLFSWLLTVALLIMIYKAILPYTFFYKPLKALMNGLTGSTNILSSLAWFIGRVLRLVLQLIFLPFRMLGLLMGFSWGGQGRYGSAKWLTGFEKWRVLNRWNKGFVIDGKRRIPEALSYRGLSLIAPTGMGKSTKFVIPNIMNAKNNSLIVTDPSGELLKTCGGILRRKNFKIKVLNMEGLQTLTYNPLHRANNPKQINKLAKILIESTNEKGANGDSFWNSGAQNIISILIRTLKNTDARFQNLANVRYLLNNFGIDGTGLNEFVANNADAATYQEYKGFISNEDKVLSGFVSTARTALEIFTDDEICTLTATENLNFESIRDTKTALFIQVPESSVRYYAPILTVLYAQIFDFLMQPADGKLSVMCLLDEFGNLGALPSMDTIMTTIRKRRVAIALILQDIQQLSATYGRDKASIILNGGTASKIILGGLSNQSCNEISAMMGVATVEEGGGLFDNSKPSEYGRKLMTPDEIRQLPENKAIFIHGNLPPVLAKMLPFFKNRKLKQWSKIKPPTLNEIEREPVVFVPLTQESVVVDESE